MCLEEKNPNLQEDYVLVNLPAKMPSAFATYPPWTSSLLHILTALPRIALLAPSEKHFPLPFSQWLLLQRVPAFEARSEMWAGLEPVLEIYPD